MTFTLLTVCTGNICRSPLAQLVLSSGLADLPGVRVHSAGIAALEGVGMPEPALRLAETHGFDGRAHRGQQVTASLLGDADLILAMSREHRRAIVTLAPASVRRTFTIRELANLIPVAEAQLDDSATTSDDMDAALTEAVVLAARLRGTVPPVADPEDLDVIDPYQRSEATYRRAYDELAPAAERVVAFLHRAARRAG